jgi:nucleoid-associated protein YgaU
MRKGAGETTAQPVVRQVSNAVPNTSFDVDLHEVKAGDTYAGISQKYLGDARYGEAIRAFNQQMPAEPGRKVQVPPIHVLRKNYPQLIGRPTTADRGTEWAPAGRSATTPGGGYKTYEVPRGGINMRGIAREAFGDDTQWSKVWNLNPKFKPDEQLEEGTKLLLPSDARVGR